MLQIGVVAKRSGIGVHSKERTPRIEEGIMTKPTVKIVQTTVRDNVMQTPDSGQTAPALQRNPVQ